MRCVKCDRCGSIIEEKAKVCTVSAARPFDPDANPPAPAGDPQNNRILWTKDLCAACTDELDVFMVETTEDPVDPPEIKG